MHLPNHALVTDPWHMIFCLADRLRTLKMRTNFAGPSGRTARRQASQIVCYSLISEENELQLRSPMPLKSKTG